MYRRHLSILTRCSAFFNPLLPVVEENSLGKSSGVCVLSCHPCDTGRGAPYKTNPTPHEGNISFREGFVPNS